MQKNNANETARNVIKTAKEISGEKIYNISHFNVADEPYKMYYI